MEGIVFQGELGKRGQVVKSWKRRWFILTAKKLSYYSSKPKSWADAQTVQKGEVDLRGSRVSIASEMFQGKSNVFKITNSARELYLEARNSDEMHSWVTEVSKAIRGELGGGGESKEEEERKRIEEQEAERKRKEEAEAEEVERQRKAREDEEKEAERKRQEEEEEQKRKEEEEAAEKIRKEEEEERRKEEEERLKKEEEERVQREEEERLRREEEERLKREEEERLKREKEEQERKRAEEEQERKRAEEEEEERKRKEEEEERVRHEEELRHAVEDESDGEEEEDKMNEEEEFSLPIPSPSVLSAVSPVLTGELSGKKLGTESRFRKRYIWVDLESFSFHWSKNENKVRYELIFVLVYFFILTLLFSEPTLQEGVIV